VGSADDTTPLEVEAGKNPKLESNLWNFISDSSRENGNKSIFILLPLSNFGLFQTRKLSSPCSNNIIF
jgi:hypothetical protein